MGWSIGYDSRWQRDIGYGVPALCDQPGCAERIDRGLGYVCGGRPYGEEHGCGLYFCEAHRWYGEQEDAQILCQRCNDGEPAYEPKPDIPEWLRWKLTDGSWQQWREENPAELAAIREGLAEVWLEPVDDLDR